MGVQVPQQVVGVHQREKRDALGSGVWGEPEKLYWSELLRARIHCVYGRAGCTDDPKSWGRVSVPV